MFIAQNDYTSLILITYHITKLSCGSTVSHEPAIFNACINERGFRLATSRFRCATD